MSRTMATPGRSTFVVAVGVALALAVVWSGAAQAQEEAGADQLRTVAVRGVGQAEAEPDEAVVRIGVTTRGQSAKAASRRAASRMSSVVAALRDQGIEEADLKTTQLDIRPYRRRNRETGEVSSGWTVNNQLKAKVPVEATGDVIDAAIAAGATDISGVRFRSSDPSAAVSEARVAAYDAAAAAAGELAAAAGLEVSGVLSIVEGDAASPPSVGPRAFGPESPVIDTTAAVEPGTIDISVRVTVVYELG